MPKRPPTPTPYNPLDEFTQDFITSTACLFAKLFKIEIPHSNPWEREFKEKVAKIAESFKIKEFVINAEKAK